MNKKNKYIFIGIMFLVLICFFFSTRNNSYKKNNNFSYSTNETNEQEDEILNIETNANIDKEKLIISEEIKEMVMVLKNTYNLENTRKLSELDLEMLIGVTSSLYDDFYAEVNENNYDILMIFKTDEERQDKLTTKLLNYKDDIYTKFYNENNQELLNKIENLKVVKMNGYTFFFMFGDLKNGSLDSFNILRQKQMDTLIDCFNLKQTN